MKKINNIFKRLYDIIFAIVFIILTSWVMVITAIIIKFSSSGSIFYKATRIGLNNEKFILYKFRSMKVDSGKIKITTLNNDDRIFPFGKIIRKTKIDELPQLFNIIKGEMSVVGPRPEDEENVNKFFVGKYKNIYCCKPGLTSPASLYDYTYGEFFETEDEYVNSFLSDKLDLELYYARNNNVIYDLWITLKTGIIILERSFGKKKFKIPKELSVMKGM